MSYREPKVVGNAVVLLAEDVDRNVLASREEYNQNVVLLAEDVDRNTLPLNHPQAYLRRPPRGGRG